MGQCKYYFEDWHGNRCFGTKDGEYCHCDGEESKCDYYPEKRKENKNTMKYDIKIGDYVETTDGIMGYVSRVEEESFHWVVTNQNNIPDAAEIGSESWGYFNEIETAYKRVGLHEFTKKNVIEPLDIKDNHRGHADIYTLATKVNEIIEWINRSDANA